MGYFPGKNARQPSCVEAVYQIVGEVMWIYVNEAELMMWDKQATSTKIRETELRGDDIY